MSCSCNCCQNHNEHHHHHHIANQQMMKRRLIQLCIASGLFLLLFIVDKIVELADIDLGIPNWILPFVLYFAVYLIQGCKILKEAGIGIVNGYFLDENFLMAVASLGAFALGIYSGCIGLEPDGFEEGCAVVIFYSIGEFFQDWALSRSEREIIKMMDEHQIELKKSEDSSHAETFISRFAKIYTPIVVGLAIAIAIIPPGIGLFVHMNDVDLSWTTWIYRALSFIVVSCPCALVISIPLSFSMGIGSAGKSGIFVMGADCLEQVAKSSSLTVQPAGDDTDLVVVSAASCEQAAESTELILMKDSMSDIDYVRRIARRTMRIIRENIIFTIGIKVAVLILSAFGITNMWIAIFADEGIALLAVLNAFRVAAVRMK